MMPGNYPLKLYHGDSYEWQFKLWLDTGKTQPLDLTDATAKAEIRDKPGGLTIFPLDCSISTNIVTVVLTAAMCTTLPIASNMAWDLQLTYATSGAVNTILAGAVTVTEDVTDSTTVTPLVAAEEAPAPAAPIRRAPRMVR
jgi:hypothetical protein